MKGRNKKIKNINWEESIAKALPYAATTKINKCYSHSKTESNRQ